MVFKNRPLLQVSSTFFAVAVLVLPFADITIYAAEPWQELQRVALGMVTPQWHSAQELGWALASTVAFALVAVVISVALGILLALIFRYRWVRLLCASSRAVHEIFWALLFMQVFGLSALTGLLAIAIPYSGIFAKVFAEILDQQSPEPRFAIDPTSKHLSCWLYTLFCQALPQLSSYTRYRFECALRSSAILGFIGLPALGLYFETASSQGDYSYAAGLLWCFYFLIASLRWWLHWKVIPLYFCIALWLLPETMGISSNYFWHFISRDIWPRELLHGDWIGALEWYWQQFISVILPAIGYTLVLSLLAMVLSGFLAITWYPIASRTINGNLHSLGHGCLLVVRSTPEFVLAFVLLLLFGPSALPAILALAIHNGGLIGYLLARNADELPLRWDAPKGFNLYSYELTPRVYPAFMSLLLYRWEVIMRETAILGLLGITTLGFYVDSAFEEIQYDKAFILVVAAAALNIFVDSLSRKLQRYCRVQQSPACFNTV